MTASSPPTVKATSLAASMLIGAAPLLFGILTWEPVYHHNGFRLYAVPVLAIALSLPLLALILHILQYRQHAAINLKVVIALVLLFTLSATNSTFVAVQHDAATAMLAISAIFAIAAGSFRIIAANAPSILRNSLLAIAIGINLYELFCVGILASLDDITKLDLNRVGVGVTHVRQLAFYGAIGATVALGFAAFTSNTRSRWLWLGSAVVSEAFIFWSGSRGGVFALLAMVAFASIALPARTTIRRLWFSIAATMPMAAALSLIWVPPSSAWGLWRILAMMNKFGDGAQAFTANRTLLWRDAVELIVQRPWTGYGQAQFRFLAPAANGYYAHPHNFVLQFLFEFGILGAALLFYVIGLGLVRGWPAMRRGDSVGTIALLGAITLLSYGLIDSTLYQPFPLFAFVILLTIAAQRGSSPSRTPT